MFKVFPQHNLFGATSYYALYIHITRQHPACYLVPHFLCLLGVDKCGQTKLSYLLLKACGTAARDCDTVASLLERNDLEAKCLLFFSFWKVQAEV